MVRKFGPGDDPLRDESHTDRRIRGTGESRSCSETDHCASSGRYLGCCSGSGCDVTPGNYWTACLDRSKCASTSIGSDTICWQVFLLSHLDYPKNCCLLIGAFSAIQRQGELPLLRICSSQSYCGLSYEHLHRVGLRKQHHER
jgi:hypothetical protein